MTMADLQPKYVHVAEVYIATVQFVFD